MYDVATNGRKLLQVVSFAHLTFCMNGRRARFYKVVPATFAMVFPHGISERFCDGDVDSYLYLDSRNSDSVVIIHTLLDHRCICSVLRF
jgi:hypothetical protein